MSTITSPYPVIYAFGDSLSDAGDAYLLTSTQEAQLAGFSPEPVSPPYFAESYGSTTADVFSNGPVWVQDLSKLLGDGTLAPGEVGATVSDLIAAVSTSTNPEAATVLEGLEAISAVEGPNKYVQVTPGAAGGTDFAIGGSVTGVTTENAGADVGLTDLSAQYTNFANEVATPVANALYTVWSGSNDLLDVLEDPNFTSLYDNDAAGNAAVADAGQSAQNEVDTVEKLIAHGANSLLVLNVTDLAKAPAITATGSATVEAAAATLASDFNTDLTNDLASARAADDLGTAKIMEEDTYSLIAGVTVGTDGLTNVTTPVYSGTGYSSENGAVLDANDSAAQDQYLFFDHLHPTETGQTAIADAALALVAPCFLAGTRIATSRGEVPVERLAIGDQVLTDGGALAPVMWIGRTPFDASRHPHPDQVWPIRIRAGAFGPRLPTRDLLVSPGHALLLDGVLMQAARLVNGATIARAHDVPRGDYFHVELPRHDILLSEGVPTESYLDTGNRSAFANAGTVTMLHPDFSPRHWTETCRKLVQDGPELVAVRRRLFDRATRLGWRQRRDADAMLLVDGTELVPPRRDGQTLVYAIGGGAARLRSSVGVPAEAAVQSGDRRRLGLAVGCVTLVRDGARHDLALDDPALGDGWHAVERDGDRVWRWTDGDAAIALTGPCQLELLVVDCLPSWSPPARRSSIARMAPSTAVAAGRR